MQNSRFTRIGKQTLKNRSNFTLLQQINTQQFSNDKPIKNASTLYLDENGKQKQILLSKNPTNKIKLSNKNSFAVQQNQNDQMGGQDNKQDMYALPIVNKQQNSRRNKIKEDLSISGNKKYKINDSNTKSQGESGVKFVRSQYMTDRIDKRGMDTIKQFNTSNVPNRSAQSDKKSLLSIRRPNGFPRRGQKFQQIDFIGGNLYQVEDIISDISKIVDKSKHKNIITSTKQHKQKSNMKSNKWLNSHFGGLSKLDQLLVNYKSIPDDQPNIPIVQDYYRQSNYKKQQQLVTPKLKPNFNKKNNTLSFGNRSKNSNQHKLTFTVIKWNQMPMIATKWQHSLFLKLQSFPQQEQYRKVVLKAYSSGVTSYSIFIFPDAGIIRNNASNDKNVARQSLMSEQKYAKTWQQKYSSPSQSILTQQQKQLLMQFDIQWYRAIIQYCYHSGLQDLLQKQYDITTYTQIMQTLQRQKQISPQNILKNQINYMKDYFKQVYAYSSNQTMIGMIRIQNDSRLQIKQIQDNFAGMLSHMQQDDKNNQFCIWPLKQDNSSLIVLLQLCGNNKIHYNSNNHNQNICIKMPTYKLNITQQYYQLQKQQSQPNSNTNSRVQQQNTDIPEYKLIFKQSEQNDWQVIMKIQAQQNNKNSGNKLGVSISQQLLFGVIYQARMNK